MGEGTLIDSSWVITAGHIGRDLSRDLENGYSPTAVIDDKEYRIEKIFVHPQFKPIVNDIALVKLQKKIASNRYARVNSDRDEVGQAITIVGRGDVGTGLTGPQKWDKVTRGATNIIDGADSSWIWFAFDAPDSPKTTDLEGISGPGDSGGPALVERDGTLHLLGISSHQLGEGKKKGTYGVTEYYSRVSSYYGWIAETMRKN